MNLKELPLSVCTAFWEEHRSHVSAYDQLKFLAITGGVPLYLESLNPNIPVDDNIQQLCFDSGGLLFREFDNIFHDLFDDRSAYYKQIVSTLVHENLDLASISRKLGTVSGGVMSECLANLVEAGFVSRDYIWSFKTGIPSKLSRYRLSDNYIRFYLHYIDPQKAKIERGLYQNHTFSSLPGWPAMMGLQFENLILANRYIIWEKLGLTVNDIVNDGSYFQKQTTQHAGCQIDYLIQTRYNNLFVCEIKFSRNAITKEVISEMQQKISRLVLPKHFSCFPVLIHANEVSDFVIDANYFSKIIDLGRLIKS